MRLAAEVRDISTLRNEASMLKAATLVLQAGRVGAGCSALMLLCDNVLARKEGIPGPDAAFWKDARELLGRIEKELVSYGRSVTLVQPDRTPEPMENKYTYEGDYDSKEHAKKLLSWNKEVYEARVSKSYVDQRLLRTLYQQQVQQRAVRIYHQHQQLVRNHQEYGEQFDTPYTRRKQTFRATEDALTREIERARPQFRDLEELSPRLNQESLARRGMTNATGVAEPATMKELARSVQLPPLNSLMNPRNQMTSPLPDKDMLLPPSPRKKRAEDEVKTRPMYLPSLLKLIAICFEEKRAAEAAAQKEAGPIDMGPPQEPLCVPLMRIIEETLHREHGSSGISAEKLQQLRFSCTDEAHGLHPRVAVFRRMAGWDEGHEMDPVQEAACVALLSWLGIATLTPPEKDLRMMLRLKDINRILNHLHRVRLLPPRAREFFVEIAHDMRLSRSEMPRKWGDAQMVDADALIWRWIEAWGGWDAMLFGKDGMPAGRGVSAAPAAAPAVAS